MADQIGNSKPVYPEWLENFHLLADGPYSGHPFLLVECYMPGCEWTSEVNLNLRQIYAAVRDHWRTEHKPLDET